MDGLGYMLTGKTMKNFSPSTFLDRLATNHGYEVAEHPDIEHQVYQLAKLINSVIDGSYEDSDDEEEGEETILYGDMDEFADEY